MANEREAKGNAEWVGRGASACWHARVSIPGEGRKRFKLSTPAGRPLNDKEADRELARQMSAELSESIRSRVFEREKHRLSARLTVKEFGELWTSGELYKRHGEVRKLKIKKSVKDDEWRLSAHVYPHLGSVPVADVTEIDVERALAKAAAKAEAKLGRPWRQATKFQVYEVMRRLFDLAIKPGRLRSDNPVSSDLRPGRDSAKLFCFLYPAELVAVLGCTKVPLARRIHYALAAYTGLRKGSLAALTWGSLDFDHHTITSLQSKTGLPQIFAQADPAIPGLRSLMVVLKRFHEQLGAPERHEPIVRDHGCKPRREAQTLRADLKAAGITRELLFSEAANVEPLRFHDMRASMVTWARRAGKGWGWISDRTGHLTPNMMDRYDRGARTLADLQYTPFPDISTALPELANDLANVTRLDAHRRGEAG